MVEGKRKRVPFPTRMAAVTFGEQIRIQVANEGIACLTLPQDVRMDAARGDAILRPAGYTIGDAVRYFQEKVLGYVKAPPIQELVTQYLAECTGRNLRPSTLKDFNSRLNFFAASFAERQLNELTLDDIKKWVNNPQWAMRTRNHSLTLLSQLYTYSLSHKWVNENLIKSIQRGKADETKPEVFTIEEAKALLTNANKFGLLPWISLGLFCGIRSEEMKRLPAKDIHFDERVIIISAETAKKRARRNITIPDALMAWIAPCIPALKLGGPIVDISQFRKNKKLLLDTVGFKWKDNGLRKSFASYHYAHFQDDTKTAYQMGSSAAMIYAFYRAVVTGADADGFWNLRPELV